MHGATEDLTAENRILRANMARLLDDIKRYQSVLKEARLAIRERSFSLNYNSWNECLFCGKEWRDGEKEQHATDCMTLRIDAVLKGEVR